MPRSYAVRCCDARCSYRPPWVPAHACRSSGTRAPSLVRTTKGGSCGGCRGRLDQHRECLRAVRVELGRATFVAAHSRAPRFAGTTNTGLERTSASLLIHLAENSMTVWRTRRNLISAIERMTTDSASHRPRLVCLCGSLVVSLAFLVAVSLFPDWDSIETVPQGEVHLRGSISPDYPSGDGPD